MGQYLVKLRRTKILCQIFLGHPAVQTNFTPVLRRDGRLAAAIPRDAVQSAVKIFTSCHTANSEYADWESCDIQPVV